MTDTEDPWFAVESAVLELLESSSFRVYLASLADYRDDYETRHLGATRANDPKGQVQYHLGYLAGIKAAIRRPEVIASGDARAADRPQRKSSKPKTTGATIAPLDS